MDKKTAIESVQKNGRNLQYVGRFNHDRDVVLAAVEENGLALEFAHRSLQNDRDVVMAAVRENGLALEFASSHLCSDKSIVMAAVTENGIAFQFASETLRNDNKVVLDAIKIDTNALQFAGERPRNDEDIATYALTQDFYYFIQFLSARIRERELLKLVIHDPRYLTEMRDNYMTRKLAFDIVSHNGMLFRNLPDRMKQFPEISQAALQNNGQSIQYMVDHGPIPDKPTALLALQTYGLALEYLSPELQADEEVVMAAVQQNGEALPFSKYKHPLITMIASLNGYVPTPRDISYVYPYMSRMIASQLPSESPENVTKRRERGTVRPIDKIFDQGPHFHKKFKRLIDGFADARYVRTPNEDMTNTVEQYEKDIANQFNARYPAEIAQEKARIQTFTGEIHRAADKLSRSRNVFGGRRTRRTQNLRHRGKPL